LKIPFEIKNPTPLVNNMIVLTNVGQLFAFGGQKIPIPNLVVRTKLELSLIFRSFYLWKPDFIFLKKKAQN
jgi:Na+/citrate or Na+/malate symporter